MIPPQEPQLDPPKRPTSRAAYEPDPLDRLLGEVRPIPDAPWFSAQVLARVRRDADTHASAWKRFFPNWLRPLPALCLVLLTGWGFFSLATEKQTVLAAKADLPVGAVVEEIVEIEDLDILLADLQMELWLHDPTL
jgi:hypothetical protein